MQHTIDSISAALVELFSADDDAIEEMAEQLIADGRTELYDNDGEPTVLIRIAGRAIELYHADEEGIFDLSSSPDDWAEIPE